MTDNGSEYSFTAPDRDRYFEDYQAGTVLGEVRVDGDEMLAFSRRYDPQDIHTDAEKAAQGPFEGLIASGWYTASLMSRFWCAIFCPMLPASDRPASMRCAGGRRRAPAIS